MVPSGSLLSSVAQEAVLILERDVPSVRGVGARVGVSRDSLRQTDTSIPLASFTSMLEAAARDARNPTLGIELGRKTRWSALGPITDLLRTAPTLGCGLRQFVRCFPSLQTRTAAGISVSNGTARLSYAIADPTIRCRTQDAGFTLAVMQSMLSSLLGKGWTASAIDFEHAAADDPASYRRHFPCPVRFGQRENAVMFASDLLNAPLRDRDPHLHAVIAADLLGSAQLQARTLDLAQSIEAWIASAISRGEDTEIGHIAREFGCSTRSFQRKLAAGEANYFDIRNRVRASIAQCLLAETDLPVTAIALQLGYSETSAFSRGFKAQVNETPGAYRKKQKRLVTGAPR